MKIASFNIQKFGVNKISKKEVLSTIIKIVSRYDIILILEVVDADGKAVEKFVTELNKTSASLSYDNYRRGVDCSVGNICIINIRCDNLLKDLVLMPVHTTPRDSFKEIDELYDVFQVVKKKWKTDNIMILGDFNADGKYVSKKKMKKIRLRTEPGFHWLIGDDVDTTVSTGNDNTYDRIVIYGDDMLKAVVPHSAKPFNFQKEYGLTMELVSAFANRMS
ncbi:Deoxyribonuclease gamma [Acipenser ruthenus]|uniref:Deoxyribonuclease gamma n=1 Tax=Acipenser ruthenus TaxID=7906 RepID=A0A662YN30_ACIRT|nr:Deoxyribonuclease gamma [Acipenser ruthenus]